MFSGVWTHCIANSRQALAKTSSARQLNRKHILFYFIYFHHDNLQTTELWPWWSIYTSTRITRRSTNQHRNKSKCELWHTLTAGHLGWSENTTFLEELFPVYSQHAWYTLICPLTPACSPTAPLGTEADRLLSTRGRCHVWNTFVTLKPRHWHQLISFCGFILDRISPETLTQKLVTNLYSSLQFYPGTFGVTKSVFFDWSNGR